MPGCAFGAGNRPIRLGRLELDYDKARNRLRRVGADEIEYDKLGSRPVRFGDLELEYDRLEVGFAASATYASTTTWLAPRWHGSVASRWTTTEWAHAPDT